MGYIIVGDTEKYEGCLVYTVAGDREFAEQVLNKIKTQPTDLDKAVLKTHKNLRVEETKPEDEWWNDPFLAN